MNMNDVLHTINGQQVASRSGAWLEIIEPATGEVCGRLAAGDSNDVEAAVRLHTATFAVSTRPSDNKAL